MERCLNRVNIVVSYNPTDDEGRQGTKGLAWPPFKSAAIRDSGCFESGGIDVTPKFVLIGV